MKKIIMFSLACLIFETQAFNFHKIKEKLNFEAPLEKQLEKAIINLDLDHVIQIFETEKFKDAETVKRLLEVSKTIQPSKYRFFRIFFWFVVLGIIRSKLAQFMNNLEKFKIDQPLENCLCKLLDMDSEKLKRHLETRHPQILLKAYYNLFPFKLVLQSLFDMCLSMLFIKKYQKISNEAAELIAIRYYLHSQLKHLVKKNA